MFNTEGMKGDKAARFSIVRVVCVMIHTAFEISVALSMQSHPYSHLLNGTIVTVSMVARDKFSK